MNKNCKPSLLIVEDDPVTYRDLIQFFQSKGFPVVTRTDNKIVDSYASAIEIADQQEPDIAILDIELNGPKSGLELGKKLFSQYKMPVLFLTGYDTVEHRKMGSSISDIPLFSKVAKIEENEMILKSLELLYHKYIVVKDDEAINAKSIKVVIDRNDYNCIEELEEDVVKRTFFCKDIYFLSSFNTKWDKRSNNHIILHNRNGGGNKIHANLKKLMDEVLPGYFVRISKYVVVSLRHLTGKDYRKATCTIGDYLFSISPVYRKEAIRKMQEYFND